MLHHVALMGVEVLASLLLLLSLHPSTMAPSTTILFQCQTHQSTLLTCTCSTQLISTTTHPFSHSITSWSNQGLLTTLYTKLFPCHPTLHHIITTVHR